MTFSSADYPLFLIAVFAVYALTRAGGRTGVVARMVTLVLLGDLLYLLLTKDVGTLWDPLGSAAFGAIAREHDVAPWWHLGVGAAVLAGALWTGWRHGAALGAPRGQRVIGLATLGGLIGLGTAVVVTHQCGGLDAMSDGFATIGHLIFLAGWGVAIGAAQTPSGRPFGRVLVLLLGSSIFYHAWAAAQHGWYRYLLLLLLAIVVGDFLLALAIERTDDPRRRKALLLVSLLSNLGVLGLFKYYDFFTIDVLRLHVSPLHLILPAGISFHTFQSLSYTIDVYKRQIPATRSVTQFATFVLFFPQLVAGPIVRAHQLLPQMDRLPPLDRRLAADGLFRIVIGLFKKIALADLLAHVIVDRVFEAPGRFSGLEVLLAVYGYAFQIYLDFSAYSDIAIGSAQLLGFEFPENFQTPYRSANLQEFWRRWHMTLSSWLRDYLYIPLGGGRGGAWLTYRNLTITMLLGGLWHGASWTFVTWGALHGLGLAVTRAFQRRADAGAPMGPWLARALALASAGASIHVTALTDHGVVFHMMLAWGYTAPLWAAATAWLTRGTEPAEAWAPAERAPPARGVVTTRAARPAPKTSRKKKARRKRRHRRQGGGVSLPRAVALEPATSSGRQRGEVVELLRWLSVGLAAAGVWAFLDAQPLTIALAMSSAGVAVIADVLERGASDAFARRWARWAARRALAMVLTFHYVCFAWVFFRATSFAQAATVLGRIASGSTDTRSLLPQVSIALIVAVLAHLFAPRTYRWARDGWSRLPTWAQGAAMVAAALALRRLASNDAPQFIYFQF